IVMRAMSGDGAARDVKKMGMKMDRPSRPGTRIVLTMNHRERTRSMNSRWATIQSLRMDGLHCASVRRKRRHAIDEHAVQRRLYQLEPLHDGAGVDQRAQQPLWIGGGSQVELDRKST